MSTLETATPLTGTLFTSTPETATPLTGTRPGKPGVEYQRSTRSIDGVGATEEGGAWELAREQERELNSECMSFAEVCRRYVAWHVANGGTRPSTVESYEKYLRLFRAHLGGRAISREVLLEVQEELGRQISAKTGKPLSPTSINNRMRIARMAWQWAEERGLVDRGWPTVKRLRERETKKRPPSREESARILQGYRDYEGGFYLPLFLFVSDTG